MLHSISSKMLGLPDLGGGAHGVAAIDVASLGHALNTLPALVFFCDSTLAYSHAMTGSARSVVYNFDCTATITITATSNSSIDIEKRSVVALHAAVARLCGRVRA